MFKHIINHELNLAKLTKLINLFLNKLNKQVMGAIKIELVEEI